jgi:hypothetical protein
MSIQFNENKLAETKTAVEERERCRRIVEGLPLGYRNEDEHEVLEKFAQRLSAIIQSGVEVTESID